MSESTEQQVLIQWFRLQYPQYRLIAIPNGQWIGGSGARKFALINKYKKEGLTPGVSDLFLAVPRGGYGGLWLEMKGKGKKKSSLSALQVEWLETMVAAGYRAEWAAGFEAAKRVIEEYLNEKIS
jgi:hypothetical protein